MGVAAAGQSEYPPSDYDIYAQIDYSLEMSHIEVIQAVMLRHYPAGQSRPAD
jgi:hypothetical protein